MKLKVTIVFALCTPDLGQLKVGELPDVNKRKEAPVEKARACLTI